MTDKTEWYKRAFRSEYLSVYSHRTDESATAEAEWVTSRLPIKSNARVLDLCCGNGRHSAALKSLGFNVVGGDLSAELIEEAHARALPPKLLRLDMRKLPFADAAFDAVVSFFTSFGYFPEDEENIGVIREIARVLKPRGYLSFDFLHDQFVRDNLVPKSIDKKGESKLTQKRWITPDNRRVEKQITFEHADGQIETFMESVRLFSRNDLREIFAKHNLTIREEWGSLSGDPFQETSNRLVVIAQKNEV